MEPQKTIGVILSGAGYLDGSEIQEAVLALWAIDDAGATARVFAPKGVLAEIDHLTHKATGRERAMIEESARIARGAVEDLADVRGTDVDGWVMPGGYGAAKSLSDFADKGAAAQVHKEVARVLREAFSAQIPIGACCIAPALVAIVAKQANRHLRLTIGNDKETSQQLASMGHRHIECPVDDIVIDADHRVVTTPAYMLDTRIAGVARGVTRLVRQVLAWA